LRLTITSGILKRSPSRLVDDDVSDDDVSDDVSDDELLRP